MSDHSNMFFNVKDWDRIACCFSSNNLIFEKPIYPHLIENGTLDTRSNEALSKFLEKCDLSGTRKETNRCEYFETIKNEIKHSHNLKFWEFVGGKKLVNFIVYEYMNFHNMKMGKNEYPIWRKPIIKKVPAETFRWKHNDLYQCQECVNIEVLLDLAKNCDILIFGNKSVHSQFVIQRVCHPKPLLQSSTTGVSQKSEILGKPSPAFLKKYPNYKTFAFDLEPCHVHNSIYKHRPNVNLHEDFEPRFSFEDMIMYSSMGTHFAPNQRIHLIS